MVDEIEFKPVDNFYVFTENSMWTFSEDGTYFRQPLAEDRDTTSIDGSLEYRQKHNYIHLWWQNLGNNVLKIRIMPSNRDPETHTGIITGIVKGSNGDWAAIIRQPDVWVNYNAVKPDHTVDGLSAKSFDVGQNVLTGDGENNRCYGKVVSVDPMDQEKTFTAEGNLPEVTMRFLVNVDLKITTFKAG